MARLYVSSAAVIGLLSGCAYLHDYSAPPASAPWPASHARTEAARLAGCPASMVFNVPSAGNPVSDAATVLEIKTGLQTSMSVALDQYLRNPSLEGVIVVSDNNALAAAVAEAAMQRWTGAVQYPLLCVVADANEVAELDALAVRKHIRLRGVIAAD